MTYMIGELLQSIKNMDTDSATQYLSANRSKNLNDLLMMACLEDYDPKVLHGLKWKRNESPMALTETSLFGEVRMLKHFLKSSAVKMERRRVLLAQILESLHPIESDVFVSIINNTFFDENKSLTPEAIKKFLGK